MKQVLVDFCEGSHVQPYHWHFFGNLHGTDFNYNVSTVLHSFSTFYTYNLYYAA